MIHLSIYYYVHPSGDPSTHASIHPLSIPETPAPVASGNGLGTPIKDVESTTEIQVGITALAPKVLSDITAQRAPHLCRSHRLVCLVQPQGKSPSCPCLPSHWSEDYHAKKTQRHLWWMCDDVYRLFSCCLFHLICLLCPWIIFSDAAHTDVTATLRSHLSAALVAMLWCMQTILMCLYSFGHLE